MKHQKLRLPKRRRRLGLFFKERKKSDARFCCTFFWELCMQNFISYFLARAKIAEIYLSLNFSCWTAVQMKALYLLLPPFAPYCGYNFNFCGGWILTKTYLFFTVFVFVDGHFVGGIDNPLLRLLFSRADHSRIPCCHVQRTTTIWTRTKPQFRCRWYSVNGKL